MTDDKDSDGPYKYIGGKFEGPNGFSFKVNWGNGFKIDTDFLTKEIASVANIAFAAGRKAERARCHAIASRDVEVLDQVSGSSFMCKPNCSCAKDILAGTVE